MDELQLILGLATMLIVAVTDYRTGKMPNVITLGSLLLALSFAWAVGGQTQLLVSSIGTAVCAAVPLVLFFTTKGKAIGGGDVKALAALGAWLGPTRGLEAEMVGFIVLAVFGLVREFWTGGGIALLKRSVSLIVPACRPEDSARQMVQLRFGPALAVGTFIICSGAWSQI